MSTRKEKIVFLGNSIVNGFPHKRSQCFASLYRDATGAEVINKGVNGETTPEALSRFTHDVLNHKPDKMVFFGGTNDYIYGIWTPKETLGGFRSMANLCKEAGIEPIFLIPLLLDISLAEELWIPDTNYKAVQSSLQELAFLMKNWGTEEAVRILDTQSFYRALYTEETKTDFLRDGLHPTVLGHEKLAEFLVSQI